MRYVGALVCVTALIAVLPPAAASAAPATPAEVMVAKINKFRSHRGLPRVHMSTSLNRSSRRYARNLMGRDALVHRARPSVSRRWRRCAEVLALSRGWRYKVDATIRRWSRSGIHRRLLLSRSFRYAGAGPTKGRFGSGKAVIWVVQMGR